MQTIHIDLERKTIMPLVYMKQRDVGAKILIIAMKNGVEFPIPADASLSVWFSGASGDGNYTQIDEKSAFDVQGSTITVELISQMLDRPGEHRMCLIMNDSGGKQKGLWNIPYYVEEIPGADSEGAKQYYQAFLNAQEAAEKAAAAAAEAAQRAERADAGNALLFEPQELTSEQQAQARKNIGAAENGVFTYPESVISANDGALVRYDSQEGLTFSYESDGFTAKQTKYLNYNYGFVFPTEVGEEYEMSMNVAGSRSPRIRIMSNYDYPNRPGADSDNFILVTLADDGTGNFVGRFTATYPESALNFYQQWDNMTLVVSNLSCKKVNAVPQIKEECLPKGSKDGYGALKVGGGIKVENGVISVVSDYEVVSPVVYAINGAGNFELYNNGVVNSNIADTDYAIRSQWANVFALDTCDAKGKLAINTEAGTTGTQKPELRFVDKVGNMIDIPQGLTVRFANMPTITNKLNILFIGDSLVASNEYVREFGNLMGSFGLREKMEFLGRQFDTDKWDTTSRYEAVGGYAWPNYVNNPTTLPAAYPHNYFWNPTSNALDIAYYFNTYCDGKAPDYIVCNVGWNQRVNYEYYRNFGFDDIEEMCKRWINAVHSAYPNCRIILNGIHYGNPDFPYPSFDYRKWGIQLTQLYNKIANEYAFVRFCDVAPYFDGRTGMPMVTRKANRFTDAEESHIMDYIHPNTTGYKMHAFADAMCLLYDYATKT